MCFIYLCLCCLVSEHFFFQMLYLFLLLFLFMVKTHGDCNAPLQLSCCPASFLRLEPNAETPFGALTSMFSEHINPLLELEILSLAASCRSYKPTFRNQQTRANGEQTSNPLVSERRPPFCLDGVSRTQWPIHSVHWPEGGT